MRLRVIGSRHGSLTFVKRNDPPAICHEYVA